MLGQGNPSLHLESKKQLPSLGGFISHRSIPNKAFPTASFHHQTQDQAHSQSVLEVNYKVQIRILSFPLYLQSPKKSKKVRYFCIIVLVDSQMTHYGLNFWSHLPNNFLQFQRSKQMNQPQVSFCQIVSVEGSIDSRDQRMKLFHPKKTTYFRKNKVIGYRQIVSSVIYGINQDFSMISHYSRYPEVHCRILQHSFLDLELHSKLLIFPCTFNVLC